jgi:hypothetical protein
MLPSLVADWSAVVGRSRRVVQTSVRRRGDRRAAPVQRQDTERPWTLTETIAEGLSAVALVAGFPLLLLAFMVSLERLETWGLHDDVPDDRPPEAHDTVEAAVEELEQLSAGAQELDAESTPVGRPGR